MRRKLKLVKLILAIAFIFTSIIPVRIAIAFHQAPVPQAIFVLGGAAERMGFAAQFWQSHQNLDIWVSDFAWNLDANRRIFLKFGVPDAKLHLDGRATDTVTNFTTLAGNFADQRLQHIYLITSDYHMRRAQAIATIVLGSQGTVVTPVAVASRNQPPESLVRLLRDGGRSFLWLVTGRTGASFNSRLKSHRDF
ncbi:YdcF family protein [Nostoc parmelioides]|uniref:YdcF family protein n=1 Tax=Nostoc parmelioides FACHB-3921 TaxID=2692909 RepID=A0ABR8BBW3_9NOSO|nr:YdcF family protein [Nostoc parmelioides]MBD2251567.1 YdcF family protein [Nostoc parmelioides FACHB-3921]